MNRTDKENPKKNKTNKQIRYVLVDNQSVGWSRPPLPPFSKPAAFVLLMAQNLQQYPIIDKLV